MAQKRGLRSAQVLLLADLGADVGEVDVARNLHGSDMSHNPVSVVQVVLSDQNPSVHPVTSSSGWVGRSSADGADVEANGAVATS
jgi:hypothetical protein